MAPTWAVAPRGTRQLSKQGTRGARALGDLFTPRAEGKALEAGCQAHTRQRVCAKLKGQTHKTLHISPEHTGTQKFTINALECLPVGGGEGARSWKQGRINAKINKETNK